MCLSDTFHITKINQNAEKVTVKCWEGVCGLAPSISDSQQCMSMSARPRQPGVYFVFGEDSDTAATDCFLLIAVDMVDLIGSPVNFIQEVLQLFD